MIDRQLKAYFGWESESKPKSTMDKTQERLLSELAVGQVDAYQGLGM